MITNDDEPTAADRAALRLTAAGRSWRDRLPEGAVIEADGDPARFDAVRLADGVVVYRRDSDGEGSPVAPYWVVVGWSNASKARQWRPVPVALRPFDVDAVDPS